MKQDIYLKREFYLQQIVDRIDNGDIKIVTGPRRCGKSWLLKKIFKDYLLSIGVDEDHIIIISFDEEDESAQEDLTNKDALKAFIYARITSDTEPYYVILDEVQEVEGFEKIVNGLNAHDNVDVYVTGSNSHFLSSDINTIFRGRGDEIRVHPLTFKEFCSEREEPTQELWKEYYTFGGMPALLKYKTPQQKINYLHRLWEKTYLADVVERNHIKNITSLSSLVDALCSSIGSLTNPHRISNVMQSVQHVKLDSDTVQKYINCLEDAFLFNSAKRFNIKGNKYFESIKKYYAVDIGLRNAKLNFRQQEMTHIMENVIYNELIARGYLVDVGVVEVREKQENTMKQIQYEVDFIATNGFEKYYIQSAFSLPTEEKRQQELKSLLKIDNSFRKFVIQGDDIATYTDEHGITFMGLFQFLKEGLS